MLLYTLIFLIPVVSWMNAKLRNSFQWKIVVCSLIALFVCFGYMTGSDWRGYELTYYSISFKDIPIIEPGYYIYSLLMKSVGFSFWPFFIITKLLSYITVVYFIDKYAKQYFYIVIALSISGFLFLYIDNPMRNLLAYTIFLFSIKYVLKKSFFKFFFVILVAFQFHVTILPFLFLYPFYNSKIGTMKLIATFLLVYLFVSPDSIFIQKILLSNFINLPHIGDKLLAYFVYDSAGGSTGTSFTIGTFIRFAITILLLYYRENIIMNQPYGNCFFNFSFLYLLFYKLGLSIMIFQRFTIYLGFFYTIIIVCLLYEFKGKLFQLISFAYIFIIGFASIYTVITSSYKYVPYTNYVFYMNEDLSYRTRYNYNFINSPYEK